MEFVKHKVSRLGVSKLVDTLPARSDMISMRHNTEWFLKAHCRMKAHAKHGIRYS